MMLSSSHQKTAHIELTTRCRLLCVKCDRTELIENGLYKNIDIGIDVVNNYAKSDFDKFILCGDYGDPIYHPRFLEIVKIFKQHNKHLHIHTNGSGKTKEWWNKLFSILDDSDVVWFAVDGLSDTSGVYRVNYKHSDFNQAIEIMNVGRNIYGLNIIWIFIAFNFNQHQIENAKKIAKENNIIFCLRKSARWSVGDVLMPDKSLVSRNTVVLKNG